MTVIIPHFNDAARLRLCLDALAGQTIARERFEVIVVDNGSKTPPVAVVEEYDFAILEHESRPGSYAARNRGLERARGEIFAFTDADCIPERDWLESAERRLEAQSCLGLIAGRIDLFYKDADHPTGAELYEMLTAFPQEHFINTRHFGATANMITSRQTIDRVGPFDASLMSNGDREFGERVHAAGLPCTYADDVCIKHPARHRVHDLVVQNQRIIGGDIDRKGPMKNKAVSLGILRTIGRALCPKWRYVRGFVCDDRLRGRWQRTKVAYVVIVLHYAKSWERIRKRLGAKSKRL